MIWRLLSGKHEVSTENSTEGIQSIVHFELKVWNVHMLSDNVVLPFSEGPEEIAPAMKMNWAPP